MSLLLALEFLTVLRLRRAPAADVVAIARSQALFPLVGLGLGLLLVGLDAGLSRVLPPAAAAALLVVALIILTGGLHLDGVADTCDGLFGAYDRQRRLEIMRDSRVGSYGALGIAAILLLKWAAILSLAWPLRRDALLLAPALGRWAMVAVIAAFPYARPQGLGKAMHQEARPYPLLLAGATALGASALLLGMWGPLAWAFVAAFGSLLALYAHRRLGGLTGDVYGAICELSETAFLLLAASGSKLGWLEPLLWKG